MLTAPLLSLFVIPAAYWLIRRRELAVTHDSNQETSNEKALPQCCTVRCLRISAQAQDSMVGMNMDGMDMKEAPSAPAAHAEGTVKAIDALGGKVTLAHGPVPALKWPAMTMGFSFSRSSSNN
jgi:hypothetical protein